MLSATGARASLASVVVGKLVARFSGAEAGDWKRSLLLLRREGGRRQEAGGGVNTATDRRTETGL